MDSGSHKPPPAGPPDHRTTRERLDSLEQENAALRAELDELRSILRVIGYTVGWDAEALGL